MYKNMYTHINNMYKPYEHIHVFVKFLIHFIFFSGLVWGTPREGLKGEKFSEGKGVGEDKDTSCWALNKISIFKQITKSCPK